MYTAIPTIGAVALVSDRRSNLGWDTSFYGLLVKKESRFK